MNILPNIQTYAIICATSLAVGGAGGYSARLWQDQAAKVSAASKAAADAEHGRMIASGAKAITSEVSNSAASQLEKTQNANAALVKQVPVYIRVKDDSACPVSRDTVRVFESAAKGDPISTPPDQSQAEPSAVHLSDIAAATTSNLNYCRVELIKYHALWDWTQRQADNASQ